jgi:hypothetical protein
LSFRLSFHPPALPGFLWEGLAFVRPLADR